MWTFTTSGQTTWNSQLQQIWQACAEKQKCIENEHNVTIILFILASALRII